MKRLNIIAFLAAIVMPLCILSCSEDSEGEDEFADWKNRNESYFQNIYMKAQNTVGGNWKLIRNYTLEDSIAVEYYDNIAVEVLEAGTGSGCPLSTDSVKVSYRGRIIPSASYPEGFVFDESYTGEYDFATATPVKFVVGNLVDGFSTALQRMHIGDHWRVYIPYQLGYGSSDNGNIPAYSTLIFDIALVSYYRAGTSTEPKNVRKKGWITE